MMTPHAGDRHVLRRPRARVWLAAAVELVIALAISRLLAAGRGDHQHHHHMGHMGGAALPPRAPSFEWPHALALAVAIVGLLWWWRARVGPAALISVVALSTLAVSLPLRVLATQSHLIAMILLELSIVVVPLLLIASFRWAAMAHPKPPRQMGNRWNAAAVAAATIYATLLVALHLPAAHQYTTAHGVVPWWVPPGVISVGTLYWAAVFWTPAPMSIRRRALFIGQEVAALTGLIMMWGSGMSMPDAHPLGLASQWDERLSGALMLAGCAAVTLPVLRHLHGTVGGHRGTT